MTARQPNLRWKPIAAVVAIAIIATMLFASFYPWLAVLAGLTLLAGGIAYAAWPPMSERIATLRSLPCPPLQSRIYFGAPIVVYGVILLALSQSQIRANWRTAETRAEVAREIENANAELERDGVDEALRICSRLDSKANSDEKTQLAALRARAQAIEYTRRTKAANTKVLQLVSDGRIHIIQRDLDNAQSALEAALHVPMATDFARATEFANEIVAAKVKMATGFRDSGELAKAKEQAQQAIAISSATATTDAKRLLIDICNREVAQLVASARESLAKMNRDEAAATLESALAIRDATETVEAQKMFAPIREARESEANAKISTIMADAQRSLDAKHFDDAIRALNAALAVPHSTQNAQVATAIQNAQKQQGAENERTMALAKAESARKAAEAEREQKAEAAAAAARKAEEEYEQNGLVVLRKTVEGKRGQFDGEITGTVINRRNRKLSYAQITFNLYDESGAQVGTAIANINGLEAGGKWKFKATSFGTDFSTYKINELSGL